MSFPEDQKPVRLFLSTYHRKTVPAQAKPKYIDDVFVPDHILNRPGNTDWNSPAHAMLILFAEAPHPSLAVFFSKLNIKKQTLIPVF